MPAKIKVTLLFDSVRVRDRASSILLNHGIATTSDPQTPILRFRDLSKAEAMRIHQVMVTFGFNYEAKVHGFGQDVKTNLAQVSWDNTAMPVGITASVSGTRIYGGTKRGRPTPH